MCKSKEVKHECNTQSCNAEFPDEKSLIQYKKYLEQELEVVTQVLQDLQDDA